MSELVSAHLKVEDGASSSNGLEIHFTYNPENLSVSKAVTLTKTKKPTSDQEEIDFGGGQGFNISLNSLMLDETLPKPSGSKAKSIKDTITDLYKLTLIDSSLTPPRSPMCRFIWGSSLKFPLFCISSVKVDYELFDRSGNPLRAKVDISLSEVPDPKATAKQNPTSRSYGRKMHRVAEGETLDWIAYQEYGDSAAWRHIAETNDLDDPLSIYPGQILRLVPPR